MVVASRYSKRENMMDISYNRQGTFNDPNWRCLQMDIW
jgi:hypothetical protein